METFRQNSSANAPSFDFVLYSQASLESGRLLAEFFDNGGWYLSKDVHCLIRWGNSSPVQHSFKYEINSLSAVKNTVNKVEMIKKLRKTEGVKVPWTYIPVKTKFKKLNSIVNTFIINKMKPFVFKDICHNNKLVNKISDKEGYYQKLLDIKNEYRVFVFRDKPFLVYVKEGGDKNSLFRKRENGWRLVLLLDGYPPDILGQSIKAVAGLGLDFGGVDVIEDKDGRVYVIEVNTAPQLNRFRARKLAEHIKEV
ncbi:MAG: hypothetical protein DDT23_00380 [candidate division WS2 bacterium]|nr:hypothetical protein [Candidatus Lithacetigena glycinireducens]